MEERKRSKNPIGYRILAIFLAALFFLGIYATLRTNIRFSKRQYVETVAKEAAQITEDNTAYLSESRLERAWKILRTTVKQPETYEDYDLYTSIAIAREDFENAAVYLNGCIETCTGTDAELAVLHMRRGSLYILMNDEEQALAELDTALELEPRLAPALYLRGQIYAGRGEEESALEDLRRYGSFDTADPAVLVEMAPLFEESGDMETARAYYTAGIEAGVSDDPSLYVSRARCEVALENVTAAKKDLETYFTQTEKDPNGEIAAMLAGCLMNTGEYAEAVQRYHQAIESGFADPAQLYEQSLYCNYTIEAYADAADDGAKAIEAAEAGADEEKRADLYFWTGMSYLAQSMYEEAAQYLEEAAQIDPDLENVQYYAGVSAMAREDYEAAVAPLTRSIEKGESRSASLYNRAVCYIQLEQYEKAEADLKEAAEEKEDSELAQDAAELLEELQEAMRQAKRNGEENE